MAIDPAAAKILAQIALKAATDEEARRRIIMIAMLPIVSVLIILSMFVYIITHPIDYLRTMFSGNELIQITNLHEQFSLEQNIDINDISYQQSKDIDYSGIRYSNGATNIIYYNQADKRWVNNSYGKTGTIGTSGCGPTALAMAISSLTDKIIDPAKMSEWAFRNGYRCENNGSYHSLIPDGARYFGLKVEDCVISNPQKIADALAGGKLIVGIMGKGHFTQSGHFIVLRGVTSGGKILVADPISGSRSEKEWDIALIIDEACKQAGAGGPFWILSK